jgi:hypothetical protein
MDLHNDGLRLRLPDPDRQQAGPALLLKDEHVRLGRTVETEARDDDFDHGAIGFGVMLEGKWGMRDAGCGMSS